MVGSMRSASMRRLAKPRLDPAPRVRGVSSLERLGDLSTRGRRTSMVAFGCHHTGSASSSDRGQFAARAAGWVGTSSIGRETRRLIFWSDGGSPARQAEGGISKTSWRAAPRHVAERGSVAGDRARMWIGVGVLRPSCDRPMSDLGPTNGTHADRISQVFRPPWDRAGDGRPSGGAEVTAVAEPRGRQHTAEAPVGLIVGAGGR